MFVAGVNFSLHFRAINGDVRSYLKDKEFLVYFFGTLIITILIFFIISVVLVTKKRNEFETNNINKNQIELTSQNTNQKNKNLITNFLICVI